MIIDSSPNRDVAQPDEVPSYFKYAEQHEANEYELIPGENNFVQIKKAPGESEELKDLSIPAPVLADDESNKELPFCRFCWVNEND